MRDFRILTAVASAALATAAYPTADRTATASRDRVAAAGTSAAVPAAAASASHPPGDVVTRPRRDRRRRRLGLDDTGVTTCANASEGGLPCNSASAGTDLFPEQDAERGRDATANDDADGHAGFAFVKLGAHGAPLADQSATYAAAPWDCLEDLVTGLVWEVHPNDGGLRDRDWRYSWYDSTGANGGHGHGRPNGGTCAGTAGCDTEKYASAVNAVGLCGFADWRLPTRGELLSLVDYGAAADAPLLDAAFLPDGVADAYWTSSRDAIRGPWSVDFSDGGSRVEGRFDARPVRLVRGGS